MGLWHNELHLCQSFLCRGFPGGKEQAGRGGVGVCYRNSGEPEEGLEPRLICGGMRPCKGHPDTRES